MKIFTISLLFLLVCLSLERAVGRVVHDQLPWKQAVKRVLEHQSHDEEDVLMDEPENLMMSNGKQSDPFGQNCKTIYVTRCSK